MYAIFETGGKQYKVHSGDVLRVEKLAGAEVGSQYRFDRVLAVSDDAQVLVGTPYLDAATVTAAVIGEGKGDKVIIYKYKAKKDYRRKQGHRQPYTEVEIETAEVAGKTIIEKVFKEKPAADAEETAAEEAAEAAEAAEAVEETAQVPAPAAEAADEAVPADAEDAPEEAAPAAEDAPAEAGTADDADDDNDDDADEASSDASDADTKKSLTKADIMEKLDALGVTYAKSAKKDELLAILTEAEGEQA